MSEFNAIGMAKRCVHAFMRQVYDVPQLHSYTLRYILLDLKAMALGVFEEECKFVALDWILVKVFRSCSFFLH